ncbi:MAG: UPF0149 family protein [Thiohalocapsa sp.]
MPLAAPDYDELDRALAVSELSPSASEAHGIYCGLVAADVPDPRQQWLSELLSAAEAETSQCRSMLDALAACTQEQLQGPALGFDLLLPVDERGLRERAVAVHEWARGFLYGLALAGLDTESLSPQSREAFDDLIEVTRMDLDDLEDEEANEQALSEVAEFIRVVAMLLHEDATAKASDAKVDH